MNEELKKALELIKNECDNHLRCKDCPLSIEDFHNYYCLTLDKAPCEWEFD